MSLMITSPSRSCEWESDVVCCRADCKRTRVRCVGLKGVSSSLLSDCRRVCCSLSSTFTAVDSRVGSCNTSDSFEKIFCNRLYRLSDVFYTHLRQSAPAKAYPLSDTLCPVILCSPVSCRRKKSTLEMSFSCTLCVDRV